jgi:tagatose-1,6-bisphosphate aldolase
METISIGKFRGLSQVSTKKSTFSILALDHRNNLRNAINPNNPAQVSDSELSDFKSAVVEAIAPHASSVLLDPEVGAAQCIAKGTLPGNIGLICAIEETGYTGDPISRKSKILDGWDVSKAKRLGASAIKLLVYYHPDSENAAEIESLVAQIGLECKQQEIACFLEPLSYSLIRGEKLSAMERKRVVIETAARLSPLGPDVLKAEFPVDISEEPNIQAWKMACKELSAASIIPWVLLSASVDYETFLQQVEVACSVGCSGVAAGRAVWKEAVKYEQPDRTVFLTTVARQRMDDLTKICTMYGRSWKDFYHAPEIDSTWFQSY